MRTHMAGMPLSLTALALGAVGGLAGCATDRRSDAALSLTDDRIGECVPVCRILGPNAGGTGIPLGNDLILTARHVVKDRYLQIDGRWSRYRVLAKGEGVNDDWVIIRCRAAPDTSSVELAPGYRPRPGEPVFLLGYWQGDVEGKLDLREARRLPLCIVRGEAEPAPVSFSIPTAGLLFCSAPLEKTSYHGISGGPVAVYDEESDTFKVVGVYKGSWEIVFLGMSRTLHTIVPVPTKALADALGAD